MAIARYCPHGNLRVTCAQCREAAVTEAHVRAAENRARGEAGAHERIAGFDIPYPWQRDALEAWRDGGRTGLAALSLGLPLGDLGVAVLADLVEQNPATNFLVATAVGEADAMREELAGRFRLRPTGLLDHHFLEPREDGVLLVADLAELETIDLAAWGRFASAGLLLLLDADGVTPHLGELLLATPFRHRFCLSRQPSAIDMLATRPWARAFGPLVYRATEEQARDWGILPRIDYRLHVELLRPEQDDRPGPEGPWEPTDIPTRLGNIPAGAFAKGKARDVAIRRAQQTPGLVVVHEGVPVPGAGATLRLQEVPDRHPDPPAGWLLATPNADGRAILRLATVAFKTLQKPGLVEDAVVLPVAADACRYPPWSEKWRLAANQVDRAVAGLLLASEPAKAMTAEDLETIVGVALALRGIPAEGLHKLSPIVAEAAEAAHAGALVAPERVREAARAVDGLAAALLVAASHSPLHLLRIAHPRLTPVIPDLPHPSLFDARRHAWRGRAFAALDRAAKGGDMVLAWGRYPELRFVFPSSFLLEAATHFCAKHKVQGPLDDATFRKIPDRTRIAAGDRQAAVDVLKEWNAALGLAEEHERAFLADMHERQPERERRREGVALPVLQVADRSGDAITLTSRDGRLPVTNIAPGSEVALVEAGGRRELARGIVSRITRTRVAIEFPAGAPRHLPRDVTVNLVFDAKVFEAYHSAVLGAQRALAATHPVDDGPDGLLRACLLGEVESKDAEPQHLGAAELTVTQRRAIEEVLSGGRVRLVHGPPGTGKTHTLVHLAMALARAGHSVLCTADSNAAVDNLVVGLRRMGALVVRIGHAPNLRDEAAEPARIDPLEAPPFVRWAGEQGVVVATTNYGAFRYIDPKGGLTPYIFDYVIHDEAGQSTAPSSLAAVLRGRRLVLAGDPKQLPPTVVSMDAKEAGLDVTLFERIEQLTGKARTRLLATQFRMREPIVAFSNRRYYEGQLETAPGAAAQEGLPDVPAMGFQHVTGRENERARNGSISNDFEVEAVAQVVTRYASELRHRGWTIAVLTPYQAQRELLRRKLPDIEVSTVDGAQGREWDVVVYSSVRSNPQHRIGFLSDERRLNVAVTRARRHFLLVGDERTLRDHDLFAALLGHCEKVRMLELTRQGFPVPVGQPVDSRERRGRRGDDRRDRRQHDGRQPRPMHRQDGGRQGGWQDGGRPSREPRNAQAPAPRPPPAERPPHAAPRQAGRPEPEPRLLDFSDPTPGRDRRREAFTVPVPEPVAPQALRFQDPTPARPHVRRRFVVGQPEAEGAAVAPALEAVDGQVEAHAQRTAASASLPQEAPGKRRRSVGGEAAAATTKRGKPAARPAKSGVPTGAAIDPAEAKPRAARKATSAAGTAKARATARPAATKARMAAAAADGERATATRPAGRATRPKAPKAKPAAEPSPAAPPAAKKARAGKPGGPAGKPSKAKGAKAVAAKAGAASKDGRCAGATASGAPCRLKPAPGSRFCARHA